MEDPHFGPFNNSVGAILIGSVKRVLYYSTLLKLFEFNKNKILEMLNAIKSRNRSDLLLKLLLRLKKM